MLSFFFFSQRTKKKISSCFTMKLLVFKKAEIYYQGRSIDQSKCSISYITNQSYYFILKQKHAK